MRWQYWVRHPWQWFRWPRASPKRWRSSGGHSDPEGGGTMTKPICMICRGEMSPVQQADVYTCTSCAERRVIAPRRKMYRGEGLPQYVPFTKPTPAVRKLLPSLFEPPVTP